MKQWTIISISILVLFLLTIRMCKRRIDNAKDEKQWYIDNLHFDFSGSVDSVQSFPGNRGRLFFHITNGDMKRTTEYGLNKQLEFNGELQLIRRTADRKLTIFIRNDIDKFQKGDSITINTDEGKIKNFRNQELISEKELISSLSGRPF